MTMSRYGPEADLSHRCRWCLLLRVELTEARRVAEVGFWTAKHQCGPGLAPTLQNLSFWPVESKALDRRGVFSRLGEAFLVT
jgi:hypothetical protein